jgi:hypothetical protein
MDRDTPMYTNIRGSVMERRILTTTEAEGRAQMVSYLIGRLPAGTDVKNGDRLQDEKTGETFIIDTIDATPRSPYFNSGIRLELRHVS